ncbi:PD-(D/E)XK nuclease family protein [Desulfonatronum thioautotrophicum]|uniref:PD-(D/E)XK nuclease family protein n=1 Tax=Desulfonatronum thioautotrophicum TaxID=617001 RepID=UPI0005EB547A|nr:PD-(D/E)XK nuclease family protein [Desulfonatronum thioautotrophicum]
MRDPLFPHLVLAPPDASTWTDPASSIRRLHGDLAHQALALLSPGETDQVAVLRSLRQARALLGMHPARLDLEPLAWAIVRTLGHPLLAELFADRSLTLAEQEIVVPAHDPSPAAAHAVVRVDRLVLLPDGTAWVLDFKLGLGDPDTDQAQIRAYQRLLADLLGRECHGALVNLEQADVVTLPPFKPRQQRAAEADAAETTVLPLNDILCSGSSPYQRQDKSQGVTPPPIRVLPLDADPIALLHDHLMARCATAPHLAMATTQVIFPHRRPRIYLHQALARSLNAPFFPPRCFSLEDWILRRACLTSDDPPVLATPLDQAWLLHDIDNRLKGAQEATPWHRFLPWGLRLTQVLDELDREKATAQAVDHPPDDLPEAASRLLADLGRVQAAFHQLLADRNMNTVGTLAALAGRPLGHHPESSQDAQSITGCSTPTQEGPTYLCGLFALTRTEADLVQSLRLAGAELWWQADHTLPEPLQRWATAWQAELDWNFGRRDPAAAPRPTAQVTLIQAHDLHSELRRLAEDAATWDRREQVALILPEPALLRPVLAHLPMDAEVNVTLGLPLERSALGLLLHTLTRMARDGRLTGVGPASRDYLDLWQNPWVRRLLPHGGLVRLRRLIQQRGHAFLDSAVLAELVRECTAVDVGGVNEDGNVNEDGDVYGDVDSDGIGHGEAQPGSDPDRPPGSGMAGLAVLFHEALELTTLDELRGFLRRLLDALQVRERAPSVLEMHAVHALYSTVLPNLEHALSRNHPLPAAALWSVFWNCLGLERIPFSGEPLTPWQVMGLLESRLLCFDKVIVLECVEGVLPRTAAPNPILPEALRPALGLQPGYAEEGIIHFHFQRLLAAAGEARLYSRQGMSPNPLEGRTMPSRYWESELWKKEKDTGKLLRETISRASLELDLGLSPGRAPEKASLADRLAQRLDRGLSLSALRTYLRCPVRFFKEEVAAFPPRPDPRQDPGAPVMGRLAHAVLEELFRPHVGKVVVPGTDLLPVFEEIWAALAPSHLLEAPLPPAARFFQARLLRELLRNYLRQSDQPVHLLAVEQPAQRPMPGAAARINLRGRLDRIDLDTERNLPVILDYKTGGASRRSPLDIHRLEELADKLDSLPAKDENAANDGLNLVNSILADPQLPGYLFLHAAPALCKYVHLGEWQAKKRLVSLVKPGKKAEAEHLLQRFLEWQENGLPRILEWLGQHILEAPLYTPTTQPETCVACPWRTTCPWALED